MQEREHYDFIFKFILIGNGNCGKTSLLYWFINHKCKQQNMQTIGVEFSSSKIQVDNKVIKLQLWDTAGQERFRSVARTYYRGALGAIILYDITDRQSYNDLEQWIKDAREYSKPDIEIIVVANKADLIDERRVSSIEAQKFCQNNFLNYIETSAVSGMNVDQVFDILSSKILQKIQKGFLDGNNLKPQLMQTQKSKYRLNDQQNNSQCHC